MTNLISAYQIGWIGIRINRLGRSARLLKRDGWFKLGGRNGDLNNRNALNWVRPVKTRDQYLATDWRALAAAGLDGIAMWLSDAQWGHNSAITDLQWRERSIIEARFNAEWPTGRRN